MSEMNVFKRNDSCDGSIFRKKGQFHVRRFGRVSIGKKFWALKRFFFQNLRYFFGKEAAARKPPHARGRLQNFLRARAGAGAKSQKSCGRGRARGPKMKNLAGAGGRGRPPARPQHPQRPQCGVFPTLVRGQKINFLKIVFLDF